MAVTIEDIAKEAGVSIATVSRVFNKTKPVSTELRDRVYAVIEKNHFKPNRLAQGLITKKTDTIGIIVPDISNAVFGKLTKGINSVFAELSSVNLSVTRRKNGNFWKFWRKSRSRDCFLRELM